MNAAFWNDVSTIAPLSCSYPSDGGAISANHGIYDQLVATCGLG